MNYRQLFAKKNTIKQKWLQLNPVLNNASGIYILTREENGFKYAYVGQAERVLDRLVEHYTGYEQYIDKSLKKHKLYSESNKTGWQVLVWYIPKDKLNEEEQKYIRIYASNGYQLRNKTSGSQSDEKFGISDNKESKGYFQGVGYGKSRTLKEIKNYFDKYLTAIIKGKPNKVKERKLKEFEELIYGETETISSETKD